MRRVDEDTVSTRTANVRDDATRLYRIREVFTTAPWRSSSACARGACVVLLLQPISMRTKDISLTQLRGTLCQAVQPQSLNHQQDYDEEYTLHIRRYY